MSPTRCRVCRRSLPELDAARSAGTEICTATYTTTQADVDRGSITNTGTAHGTPPTGPDVTNDATATVPATVSPAITFVKSATPLTFSAIGEPIAYATWSPTPAT